MGVAMNAEPTVTLWERLRRQSSMPPRTIAEQFYDQEEARKPKPLPERSIRGLLALINAWWRRREIMIRIV
jgi:hypothetical protein